MSSDRSPLAELDRNFGFLISDVARLLRHRFDQRAQSLGLTRTQWRALGNIGRQEGINQAALAELLEVEPITLARLIDRLEAGGFVERRNDPADRRTWRLYLTPKAHPVLLRMREIGTKTLAEAFAGLSRPEVDALHDTLERIKANLSASTSLRLPERAPSSGRSARGRRVTEYNGLRRAGGRHG